MQAPLIIIFLLFKSWRNCKKGYKNDLGLRDLSYEERLNRFGLITLEWRNRCKTFKAMC